MNGRTGQMAERDRQAGRQMTWWTARRVRRQAERQDGMNSRMQQADRQHGSKPHGWVTQAGCDEQTDDTEASHADGWHNKDSKVQWMNNTMDGKQEEQDETGQEARARKTMQQHDSILLCSSLPSVFPLFAHLFLLPFPTLTPFRTIEKHQKLCRMQQQQNTYTMTTSTFSWFYPLSSFTYLLPPSFTFFFSRVTGGSLNLQDITGLPVKQIVTICKIWPCASCWDKGQDGSPLGCICNAARTLRHASNIAVSHVLMLFVEMGLGLDKPVSNWFELVFSGTSSLKSCVRN